MQHIAEALLFECNHLHSQIDIWNRFFADSNINIGKNTLECFTYYRSGVHSPKQNTILCMLGRIQDFCLGCALDYIAGQIMVHQGVFD